MMNNPYNMMQEAAAAVAANHKVTLHDVFGMMRFALGTMLTLMLLTQALCR